jgi:hypothetical protein
MEMKIYNLHYGGTCPYCNNKDVHTRGQYKKHFKTLFRLKYHFVWYHKNEDYLPLIDKIARELVGGIKVA